MPKGKYRRRDPAIYTVPPPGSRMLVYLRFSGEDQDAASQEAAVRRWVLDDHGWIVYPGEWFVDEARSGSSTRGRDQFQALISLAERLADDPGRPAGVALWKFNRFGRDLLDSQLYKAHLRRLGYALVSMADDVPQSDIAPLYEALLDWKAERDLRDISTDVKRAFAELQAQGYQTGGFPPRGLRVEKEIIGQRKNGQPKYGLRWVADPALTPLIGQAFEQRAGGAPYAALLRGPLRGLYTTKNSLPTFFANRHYVEAGVISEELFQRVQAEQLRHARKIGAAHPRRVGSPFLLSGLLFCACGSAMVGNVQRGRWIYYRCGRQMRSHDCPYHQPRVAASWIEDAVLNDLLTVVLTPGRIGELTAAVNAELNGDAGLQAQAVLLRQQLADLDAHIARLLDALETTGLDSVGDRLQTREKERRLLRGDLQLLEAQQQARHSAVLSPAEVAGLLTDLRAHREAADTLELRAILRLVIDRIVVDGHTYRIEYHPAARPWFAPGP